MKSKILLIMKKEFDRFFGDRRLVLGALLGPGALIWLMYTLIGVASRSRSELDTAYIPTIYAIDLSASIQNAAQDAGPDLGFTFTTATPDERDVIVQRLSDKSADILLVFPAGFDEAVARYDTSNGLAPNIEVYYNSNSDTSRLTLNQLTSFLERYEADMANKFDVNRGVESADVAGEGATLGRLLAQLAPMLIMMFMVLGAVITTPESIAGEKERGTLATLLITPISRGELAAGKILSLGIEAFLCGLSSLLGLILSLPTLLASYNTAGFSFDISAVYGVFDYLGLILLVLPSIFLTVTLATLISAYARNVKEASTSVSFLMLINVFVGTSAMFDEGAKQAFYYYLIPFYNSAQCMVGIFSLQYSPLNLAITIAANALYTVIGAFCLAKMFGSEKIMFSH